MKKKSIEKLIVFGKIPLTLLSAGISLFASLAFIIKDHTYLIVLLSIFATFSTLFISIFIVSNKKNERKSFQDLAKEIEQKRIENIPDSAPHLFENGICKYCGNSISAVQYFKWYSCKKAIE